MAGHAPRSLDPRRLGIPSCEVADLAGGDAATNAAILRDAFGGARSAVADALNLNAGVALAAAEVAPSAEAGVALAQARPSFKVALVPSFPAAGGHAHEKNMCMSRGSVCSGMPLCDAGIAHAEARQFL